MRGKTESATGGKKHVKMKDIAELLMHALAIETEAVERYAQLADLMEAHNNYETANFFLKMSEIEQLHVDQIADMIKSRKVSSAPLEKYRWSTTPEGPESTDPADLHYLMTPYQALVLALNNEQRAHDFYSSIVTSTKNEAVRRFAAALAEEEEEHVAMVKVWLDKVPKTPEDWDYDDDPPAIQD